MNPSPGRTRVERTHLYLEIVFVVAVLYLVYRGLAAVGNVLAPVMAALTVAYVLDPVVDALERRRMHRGLATLLLLLAFLLLVAAMVLVVVPLLFRQAAVLSERVPSYLELVNHKIVPWVQKTFHVTVPATLQGILQKLDVDFKATAEKLAAPLAEIVGRLFRSAVQVVLWMLGLLLIPFFTFYFLRDFNRLADSAKGLVPRRYRPQVYPTLTEINRVLAAWVRGQITVVAVRATLYCLGLSIAGLEMAVLIGVVAGLFSFIPYAGFGVGGTLSVLISLLNFESWGQVIGVVAVFVAVEAIDGFVVTPRVIGSQTGLGPVGVIVAVMLGGRLLGFVGVLLAVPAAAAINVVVRRLLKAYRNSRAFLQPEPLSAAAVAGHGAGPAAESGTGDGNHPGDSGQDRRPA